MASYTNYGFWAEFDGRKVEIDGHVHILRVSSYEVIFPVKQRVISVYAEPVDKTSKWYCAIRAELRDDWSTDVLQSPEVESAIYSQLPELSDHALAWQDGRFETV